MRGQVRLSSAGTAAGRVGQKGGPIVARPGCALPDPPSPAQSSPGTAIPLPQSRFLVRAAARELALPCHPLLPFKLWLLKLRLFKEAHPRNLGSHCPF